MAGILTCKVKLGYRALSSGVGTGTFSKLDDMSEIPDIGGTAESIEVTTLDNVAHVYTNGLKDYGDSLDFTFLHSKALFDEVRNLNGAEKEWQIALPDGEGSTPDVPVYGTTATFKGTPSIKINGEGTNAALYCSVAIKPTGDIIFGTYSSTDWA